MNKIILLFLALLVIDGYFGQIKLDSSLSQHANYLKHHNSFLQYGFVIPQNIDECILVLMHSDTCRINIFMDKTEEEAEHYGFEEYNNRLRNAWDLDNGSVLAQYFYNHKVYNTEVMKSIILVSLYRYIESNNTDFDTVIEKYRKVYQKENKASKKRIFKESKLRYRHHKRITKRIRKERRKALKQETKNPAFDEFYD